MVEKILVTGSAGLIGSEAVGFYAQKGNSVIGIDNNLRMKFFGSQGDTRPNLERMVKQFRNYTHHDIDIRDSAGINRLFKEHGKDISLVIHCAAQPSHDWAAQDPQTDFSVNAVGTLNMLEAVRNYAPDSVFIFTSTNKVYGDNPNKLPLVEKETRYELDLVHKFHTGIDETMSLDDTLHSVFGVSKVAADLMVQEYGKNFGLKTGVFRGGCLTGPNHAAAPLHGFLAYLVKAIKHEDQYTIHGYKGKQVRDNIHAHDLVNAFNHFYHKPHPGEVYNIGGARNSNISMEEAIRKIELLTNKKAKITYSPTPRTGDHIWYISDVSKFKNHYPAWTHSYDGEKILKELCQEIE